MKRFRPNIRIISLALAFLLSVGAVLSIPGAFSRAEETANGTVRVYLASLGSPSTLHFTCKAAAQMEGEGVTQSLSSGSSLTVSLNAQTGEISAATGGRTYACGTALLVQGSAFSLAEAASASNTYPGSFLISAQGSPGSYALFVVFYVPIEDYLLGVLPYEMGSSAPLEALKAQAICARTYTLRSKQGASSKSYDVTDTISDQVYRGTGSLNGNTKTAVQETAGMIAQNGGQLTATYYTASNGGQTESVQNAWGSAGYTYLKVKDDPYDESSASAKSASFTVNALGRQNNETLDMLLNQKATAALGRDASVAQVLNVSAHTPRYASPSRLYTKLSFFVVARSAAGFHPLTLTFDIFSELSEKMKMNLGTLKNELWTVSSTQTGFRVTARRWGHGIGMSQWGAQAMAAAGKSCSEILSFYYEGCTLTRFSFSYSAPTLSAAKPQTLTPVQASARVTTPSGSLNLRKAPTTAAAVLRTIPRGAAVTVTEAGEEWCRVQYAGSDGYVMRTFLTFDEEPALTAETASPSPLPSLEPEETAQAGLSVQVLTPGGSLNLRAQPTTLSRVLTTIPQGTLLIVYPENESWCAAEYNGRTGFVMRSFLKTLSAETSAPPLSPAPTEEPAETPAPTASATPAFDPGTTPSETQNALPSAAPSETPSPAPSPAISYDLTKLPQPAPAQVVPEGKSLRLRDVPGDLYAVLANMPDGDFLLVLAMDDTWCQVQYEGQEGYCLRKYIRFAQDD